MLNREKIIEAIVIGLAVIGILYSFYQILHAALLIKRYSLHKAAHLDRAEAQEFDRPRKTLDKSHVFDKTGHY